MTSLGLLGDTLLPNLLFHTSLALPAYLLSRQADRVEGKDYLWASAQVGNVWYTSIGRRLLFGVPLSTALHTISRPGWLLISGVTLWGCRLTYRIVSRSIRRKRGDDERYDDIKRDDGWTRALWELFIPETVVQSIIALPFTAPFRTVYPVWKCPDGWKGWMEVGAIGLFGVGFAMEVMADWQLQRFKKSDKGGMCKEGVWSIVRHPNYLGDALIHFSLPLILIPYDLFNPLLLLGPLANYLFLRNVGGDKQNEESQAYRYATTDPAKMVEFNQYKEEKNAFWPGIREVGNKWVWAVIAAGAGTVCVERAVRGLLR